MILPVLLSAALILPSEAKPIPAGEAVAWLSVGAGSALWSTGFALERGAREANPLGGNLEQRVGLQFAFVGLGALAVHQVSKKHPKAGKRLLIGLVIMKAVETALNIRTGLQRGGAAGSSSGS